MMCGLLIALLTLPAAAPLTATAEEPLLVHGFVTTAGGYRISHVKIRIQGSALRTRSDREGNFELRGRLPDGLQPEAVEVWASYPGFEPVVELVDLTDRPIELTLLLELEKSSRTVTVNAKAPPPEGTAQDAKVAFLDIVSTAGTNADPLYTAQMLPGVVKVDDGAGLFVRGGDVSETATYLDRSLLDHPFRNETPSGGFFGTVDVFQIQGLSLTTGGFPARFGNALSGVLELESRQAPSRRNLQLNLGLAGASFQFSQPLGQGRSLRVAANRIATRALVAVNGTEFEFTTPPRGWDANLTYFQSLGGIGSLRFGFLNQVSSVGSQIEESNFDGFLESSNRNRVAVLSWEKQLGWKGEIAATLTLSGHSNRTEIGVLDIDGRESVLRFRLDYRRELEIATLRTGFESERIDNRSIGSLPRVGVDFAGVQGTRLWDQRLFQNREGGYLELERGFGPVLVNAGLRVDSFGLPSALSVEPRFSMTYQPRSAHRFRLATGIYRQSPDSQYLNDGFGNRDLGLMSARHWILGYRYGGEEGPLFFRLEGYRKDYSNLPLEDPELGFNDNGFGRASGIDAFLSVKRDGWDVRTSYSYLRAERLYTPWQRRGQFEVPDRPYAPDFAVPHTFQVALRKRLFQYLDVGATFRTAAGLPFTPVTGVRSTPAGVVPVYGEINSARVPVYRRFDLSFSHPVGLFQDALTLLYLGINDVFNRRNFYRFVYSEDYGERRPAATSFGRTFYFGITFNR